MPFRFRELEIPDLILVVPEIFTDNRGHFIEVFKEKEFRQKGITLRFVQDNQSRSRKNVIRGLHYQLNPNAQGKLLRAVRGSLLAVAVDIRAGSPYYKKWVSVQLSSDNRKMLWVPPGFAAGAYFFEDDTELLYKVTGEYCPDKERGIIWNDPGIGVKWPADDPILSAKDRNLPTLKNAENNFVYKW